MKKNYVINNNAQYGWRKNVIKKYDIKIRIVKIVS